MSAEETYKSQDEFQARKRLISSEDLKTLARRLAPILISPEFNKQSVMMQYTLVHVEVRKVLPSDVSDKMANHYTKLYGHLALHATHPECDTDMTQKRSEVGDATTLLRAFDVIWMARGERGTDLSLLILGFLFGQEVITELRTSKPPPLVSSVQEYIYCIRETTKDNSQESEEMLNLADDLEENPDPEVMTRICFEALFPKREM